MVVLTEVTTRLGRATSLALLMAVFCGSLVTASPDVKASDEPSTNILELGEPCGQCNENEKLENSASESGLGKVIEKVDQLNSKVVELLDQGDYRRGIELGKEALAIAQTHLGDAYPATAASLYNLAEGNRSTAHYADAELLFKRSLAIRESLLGPEHPAVADNLNKLALLYVDQGRYEAAESLHKRSLAIRKKVLGPEHQDVAESNIHLAALKVAIGRIGDAEQAYKKSIAIIEKTLGPEHRNIVDGLNHLSSLYIYQGRYIDAKSLCHRSLAISEAALGPEHPDVATSLNNLAELYRVTSRYNEAEPLYKRSLAIIKNSLGSGHPYIATSLNNLALLYEAQGRFTDAESLLKKGLSLREAVFGSKHLHVAEGLNNLAELYRVMAKYSEAEPLYKRSLEIVENSLGFHHPHVVTLLNNLALLYAEQGRLTDAEPLFKKALTVGEVAFGSDYLLAATILNNLAELYRAMARYAEAEPLYKRSMAIVETELGLDHPSFAMGLNNLALLYMDQGRFTDAEQLYMRALAIAEASLGSAHATLAAIIDNLASLYQQQGLNSEAESLHKRSLNTTENWFGTSHPAVATSLNNLALLYDIQGRYVEAERLFDRSLAIMEKAFGTEHPAVATLMNNLAMVYMSQGYGDVAALVYKKSLALREKLLGPEHPDVATSLNNLAGSYVDQGRYAEAEPLYKEAIMLNERGLGPEHPNVAASLDNLAWLYREQGKTDLEQPLRRRVQQIDSERLLKGSHNLGDGLTDQRWHAVDYLHLLARMEAPNAEEGADSLLAVQLARRAVHGEAFRLLAQRLAAGGSGELSERVRERQDLIRQLNVLQKRLIDGYGMSADERPEGLLKRLRIQIGELDQKVGTISERLQREFPSYTEFEGARLADLDSLQRVMQPGEAVLAWVLGEEESYLLIVPRRGKLQLKVLSLTEQSIAEKVQKLHRSLDLADPEHYGELAPFPAAVAADLFMQLFGSDWEAALKDVQQLLLVAEGPLTRLAFPVLLTEAPQEPEFTSGSPRYKTAPWLVRRFSISVLPSLSALTALRGLEQERQAAKPFLGVGDPLLDDHPAKRRGVEQPRTEQLALLRNVRDVDAVQPLPASPADMRRVRLERIRQQPSLTDTAEELWRVARVLGVGEEALLLREAATEQQVKQRELEQYAILSFATHGVLAGELGQGIEPGLILTPPSEPTDEDDGFLALSEVARLKLNADWVVLSACNTGGSATEKSNDPVRSDAATKLEAEGLTGLAKAFSYAGAKALLVSHWSVGSAATVQLMEQLFLSYRERNTSRAEAHRQAMLEMIDGDDPLFSHPSFWAPFVVVGDGG